MSEQVAKKGTATEAGSGGVVLTWLSRVALLAWLLSLLFTFLVLFPFRYRCVSTGVSSIKSMYKRIARLKWVLLILSTFLFFAALCVLVALLF